MMPKPSAISDARLRALVAVADHESFTSAARSLGVTQSSVSHAVKGLESTLGVKLLDRTARGTRLTEVGERTLELAREILRLKLAVQLEADAARAAGGGVVRLGSFGPTSSRHLLPPILRHMESSYPRIEIRVLEGSDPEVVEWVRERVVDVGFVTLPNREFDTVGMAEDEMVVLLPTGHPLAARSRIAPRELDGVQFVMSTGGCELHVQRILAATRPNIRYRIREVQTILEIVDRGQGVSIKPVMSLPDRLPEGVVHRPLDPPVRRRIGVAMADRSDLSPAARVFIRVAASHRALA